MFKITPLTLDSQEYACLINDLKQHFKEPYLYIFLSGENPFTNVGDMLLYLDYCNDNSIIKKIIRKENKTNLLAEIEIIVTRNFIENNEMTKLLVASRFVFIFGFYDIMAINKIEVASKRWSLYSKMGKKRWKNFSKNFFFIDVEHAGWRVL